ncbi:hypothetical protein [Yoonia sp. R2-816]|uniref:hypothetical protein n=1 Tax=Yoonia sp. R2-816 TaxID=3342638 RepID=UPI003727C3F9
MTVDEIEQRCYDVLFAAAHQMKIAKLIVIAFRGEDTPCDKHMNAALDLLSKRDDIFVLGNVRRWRHTEIKRMQVAASRLAVKS